MSTIPPYLLLELPNITESINYPIKNVQRIKYTCFDVSKSLIAFGATSGGIYIFNRNPCEFVQLIPNKDGTITRLSISTDEKHIGFANGRGLVSVTSCDQSTNVGHSTVSSKEHQGNEVTILQWNNNMLFSGDDVGKVAVLQLQSFIAKTMFQSSSQTIMNLDSRICQIDVKSYILLVSTLTRVYVCDTVEEQYRQIGHKLRDGEFGACFFDSENTVNNSSNNTIKDYTEVKKYNIVNEDTRFAVGKDLENTYIFCARPSSRLWEASIDGTVKRTHQFKSILGKHAMNIIDYKSYESQSVNVEYVCVNEEGLSVNFPRIYNSNDGIFSFKKDALFFLNLDNVDHTVWCNVYKDIVDCKRYQDLLYLWLTDGRIINLRFMKIDKFLMKCFVDEKPKLCAEMCHIYQNYLLSNELSTNLHILASLKDKIDDLEMLNKIEKVLEKFAKLKSKEATQMKSGIYVVDNTYNAQNFVTDRLEYTKNIDDYKFSSIPPEAIQTLKDLSSTVTGRLNSSKKKLKEKWGDFEEKMKNLSVDNKPVIQELNQPNRIQKHDVVSDEQKTKALHNDIIYKVSSQELEIDDSNVDSDNISKSLYQYFRLSLLANESEETNLISFLEKNACDIREVYELMLILEKYCLSVGALEESKFVPNHIFLTYLSHYKNHLNMIVEDEVLYKYFVDSCIAVNMKSMKLGNLGCECGFPLPYTDGRQVPMFSELIDEFIEMQWSNQTKEQCYDVCKRMPYLWRKILHLRRNEDLLNILRILLQMLDEDLLHNYLPQFTLETWDRAVQLYATLHGNICLNCSKRFDHISVKDTLSWDDIGGYMIKSVGGRNAIKVMDTHSHLIDPGEITVKFYHTCLLVTLFEKYDSTVRNQLTRALYDCYGYEDSREEICNLLRNTVDGNLKNTALPITIAAKTQYWGMKPLNLDRKSYDFDDILNNIAVINNGVTDCTLCGLPLRNDVLIKDGGVWVFKCGHTFHGACLNLNKIRLCPSCCSVIK